MAVVPACCLVGRRDHCLCHRAGYQSVTNLTSADRKTGSAIFYYLYTVHAAVCVHIHNRLCVRHAAVFGSATNTVIAPILIGLEVFGSQNAIPLVVVCLLAYMINGNHSIYGAQVKARCSFEEK